MNSKLPPTKEPAQIIDTNLDRSCNGAHLLKKNEKFSSFDLNFNFFLLYLIIVYAEGKTNPSAPPQKHLTFFRIRKINK